MRMLLISIPLFLMLFSCKKVIQENNTTIIQRGTETLYVDSVKDLSLVAGTADFAPIYVKDSLRGGAFYFKTGNYTPDSGTVFKAAGTGYWIRPFEKTTGYNVEWFGAKGDGVTYDDVFIQYAIDAAGPGAIINCSIKATYLLRNAIVLKNNQTLNGNNATFKRGPTVERLLDAPAVSSATSLTLDQDAPVDWKAGDDLQLYIDSTGDKASVLSTKIEAVNGKIVTLAASAGVSNNGQITSWPAGAKVRKVFTMITAPDPNKVTTVVYIKNLTLDGNKAENAQNLYWGINSAVFLRGIGTRIENCILKDMPNESITGHGLIVENCQAYNLNGSFVHLSGLLTLEGQAHSFITDNYTDGTNMVPNAVSKHSEAVITTSFSGGYATITNNRFYNGGESVIGHLNPSTGDVNDGGTSDVVFQNNICINFKKIVYQIIDPINFGYTDSAKNIIIANNVFSACGVTDWRNYEYFMKWYIGLQVKNNVYSNGTQFLLPPSLLQQQ